MLPYDRLEVFKTPMISCNIWALPKGSHHGNQGFWAKLFYHTLGHCPSHPSLPYHPIKSKIIHLSILRSHYFCLWATQIGEESLLIFTHNPVCVFCRLSDTKGVHQKHKRLSNRAAKPDLESYHWHRFNMETFVTNTGFPFPSNWGDRD